MNGFSTGIQYTLVEGGVTPVRATPGAACYDLCARVAPVPENRHVEENGAPSYWIDVPPARVDDGVLAAQSVAIPVGIRVSLPGGWEAQVRSRSGLALRSIITPVGLGTIDSDYTDEVHAILLNLSGKPFRVKNNHRIAQIIFYETSRTYLQEVTVIPERAGRKGGFGSTGI